MKMSKLTDIKIGKKLAILLASGIVAVVCVGSLSLCAIGAIRTTVGQEQIEDDQMMSAQRVGSDLGTINAVVGHITLSRDCKGCHGTDAGGDRSDETSITKECRSLLSGMKTNERTAEGKKLLDDLATAGTGWLEVNVRVLDLGLAGKSKEALALYRDESIPSVGPVQHALAGYMSWQQQRLLQKRVSAEKIM